MRANKGLGRAHEAFTRRIITTPACTCSLPRPQKCLHISSSGRFLLGPSRAGGTGKSQSLPRLGTQQHGARGGTLTLRAHLASATHVHAHQKNKTRPSAHIGSLLVSMTCSTKLSLNVADILLVCPEYLNVNANFVSQRCVSPSPLFYYFQFCSSVCFLKSGEHGNLYWPLWVSPSMQLV